MQASGSTESCRLQSTNRLSMDLRDVYLGGSCYLRTMWRQKLAIPYLKTKGITFHLSTLRETFDMDQNEEDTDVEEEEVEQKITTTTGPETHDKLHMKITDKSIEEQMYNPVLLESSRILLFVITNETRSLAPMTLAAHCIGLMYNVVLVVQMLPEDCVIGNDQVPQYFPWNQVIELMMLISI